jgi:hypothetical protein
MQNVKPELSVVVVVFVIIVVVVVALKSYR